MELRQLRTFLTIAKLESFTQAAETLGYAQSSVTAQVRLLEESLGVKLFERLGRRIILTQEAKNLIPYAEQILKLVSEAHNVVSGTSIPKGTLTIGTVESLSITRLPKVFEEYHNRYPNVEIVLNFDVCSKNLRLLRTNVLDVTFIIDRKLNSQEFIVEELTPEQITVLVSPGHHLAAKKEIYPADLQGESLILTEEECTYRIILENILAEAGVQPKYKMGVNSIQAIKQFTISGLGVTLLPETAVKQEVETGQLVKIPWAGPDFKLINQLVYHKDKWMSPTLQSFLELTRQMLKSSIT
ncbi:LysR family transcriptional regulator [Desulforamulus aeronauticus]|uniref:DNA-binding transcriptional regulator, LysR family n=1 Tax=Desulforamulus aeronauticus DSM 10349 TaxID=1121421 RepID=A0A1M6TC43_9FIRM|nr:LysR family transcriptional regulator [Desulforamulus aeronauticus]SHK54523.1 DNA-binding transcriptional regulator, LysR family [Desulforamulus aeronauticus DSM 10349]